MTKSARVIPGVAMVAVLIVAALATSLPSRAESDSQYTYSLHFRWSFYTWYGADGVSLEDALTGQGGGSDISDSVTAVYGWVAEEQRWVGFFPEAVNVPGANDLISFEHGAAYWFAINDPGGVQWTIGSGGASAPAPADAAATLGGWIEEVMALSSALNDVLARANTPGYSVEASANESRSVQADVRSYLAFLEAQDGSMIGYPAVCESAYQQLVDSMSWLDVEAGWWIRFFEEWPFGDYEDEVIEAQNNHFDALEDAYDSIIACALS